MKKILKFLLIYFSFFLVLWLIAFNNNYGDPIASYGFAYAIIKGEIPYLDFNIISTPLFAFFNSLGLLIFNNYIVILMQQALILTIASFILKKMYNYKAYFLLIIISLFQFSNIIPTYNTFLVFLIILIIYFEKYYAKFDYLIGFLIALCILTKHTVGVFLIIPSIIFYYKDKKKLIKRFIGLLIPCLIFVIYLLINKAFLSFLDLSILGLFNFADNNTTFNLLFIILLFLVLYSIYFIIRNKKEIANCYLFFTFLIAFPVCDLNHFSIYVLCFSMIVLSKINFNERSLKLLALIITMGISIFTFLSWLDYNLVMTKEFKHFDYGITTKYYYEENLKKIKYIDNFKNVKVISYYSMFYDICRDKKIDYFDVLLEGNYGKMGYKKMINKIEKMHNQYFVVNMTDYKNKYKYSQISKEIAKYIIENYDKVDEKYDLVVYYKK